MLVKVRNSHRFGLFKGRGYPESKSGEEVNHEEDEEDGKEIEIEEKSESECENSEIEREWGNTEGEVIEKESLNRALRNNHPEYFSDQSPHESPKENGHENYSRSPS